MYILLGHLIGSALDPAIILPSCIAAAAIWSMRAALTAWAALSLVIAAAIRYPANARVASEFGMEANFGRSLFWTAAGVAVVMGLVILARLMRPSSTLRRRAMGPEPVRPSEYARPRRWDMPD